MGLLWPPWVTLAFSRKFYFLLKLNNFIRTQLYFESEFPLKGDRVICLRNNKKKNIFNGLQGTIKEIYDTWVFSRDTRSRNPNWQLVDTLT